MTFQCKWVCSQGYQALRAGMVIGGVAEVGWQREDKVAIGSAQIDNQSHIIYSGVSQPFLCQICKKTYVMKENKTNDIAPYFSHQSKFVWKHSVSPRKLFIFIWFICLRFVHKINRTAKWLLPAETDCGGVSLFKPLPFHSFFHRAILHSKVLKTTRCPSTVFVAAGWYAGSFTTCYHLVGQHWIVLPVTAFCSQK